MPAGRAERYRTLTLPELLAEVLPVSRTSALRRRLAPLFTRLLSARGGLTCRLPDGETFRISPGHRHVTWNPVEYRCFKDAIRPGGLVFDVGAHMGAYTMLFAERVGPAGQVLAFEPDPLAYSGLCRHVALNAFDGRVRALPLALSDRHGLAAASRSADGRIIEAQTTTVDRICGEAGLLPDVIKIDVEGAELAVLRGARETISAGGARLTLFVEMHPALWASAGHGLEELQGECLRLGLEPESLCGDDPWRTEGVCVRMRRRS